MRLLLLLFCGLGTSALAAPTLGSASPSGMMPPAVVTIDSTRVLHRFSPDEALGAGLDGHEHGETRRIFSPANVAAMKSVGLRSLTYRLRTELGIEAWHANPRGRWSEGNKGQGYWTSNVEDPRHPVFASYGYRLPRRGSTIDQANNDGFSRVDDGDPKTFWKSNPYLDQHFTGEPNTLHPAWLVFDLGKPQLVNAMRLGWAAPYATCYHVSYWDGPFVEGDSPRGAWRVFPQGTITNGRGGLASLLLSGAPVLTQFVRIEMTQSAGGPKTRDIRDRLGFALAEASVGLETNGTFRDWVVHARGNTQTKVYASSCDPWHRASDVDRNTEQPGFAPVMRSGLTSRLPVLVAVGVLYDTPDNAANFVRSLLRRGVPIRGVELGEEPDGQYSSPEDYAALYVQFARAIHRVDRHLELGGPSFQSTRQDVLAWPSEPRPQTWLHTVLAKLRQYGARHAFSFCSFEWYPFDDVCAPSEPLRRQNPTLLRGVMARMRASGLRDEPFYLTEYGYSAYAARPEVNIDAALFDADCVGTFLSQGGQTAFFYGYEPGDLLQEKSCPRGDAWGNDLMLLTGEDGQARYRLSAFWAHWLLTHVWTQAGRKPHMLYPCQVEGASGGAVTAYALRLPDSKWSLLLVNHQTAARRVKVRFHNGASAARSWTQTSFGVAQYVWHAGGKSGFPSRSLPPVTTKVEGDEVVLPAQSVNVVREDAQK